MTDLPILPEDDDDALAAEYVLGVQDASERAAVEARIRRDAGFARAVAEWETRLGGLNAGFAEVPAPNLLPAIEARLFGTPPAAARRRWSLNWLFGAGLAAALGVFAFILLSPAPPPQAPLVATLSAENQPLVYAARYDRASGELTLTRAGGPEAEAGRVHELWLIAGSAAPVSLGLIESAEFRRALPDLPAGAVLAVSLEPAGGSPTGQPTGPVLVTGAVEL